MVKTRTVATPRPPLDLRRTTVNLQFASATRHSIESVVRDCQISR